MSELKGYSYLRLNKKDLFNGKLICELRESIDISKLEKQMKDVSKNGGITYAIKKEGEVRGIVVIACRKFDVSDFDCENNNQSNSVIEKLIDKVNVLNNKFEIRKYKDQYQSKVQYVNCFKLEAAYLSEELLKYDKLVKFDIIDDLKRQLGYSNYNVRGIIWEDDVVIDKYAGKTVQSSQALICALIMLFCGFIGLICAVTTKHYLLISYGVCMGLMFGIGLAKQYFKTGKLVKGEI